MPWDLVPAWPSVVVSCSRSATSCVGWSMWSGTIACWPLAASSMTRSWSSAPSTVMKARLPRTLTSGAPSRPTAPSLPAYIPSCPSASCSGCTKRSSSTQKVQNEYFFLLPYPLVGDNRGSFCYFFAYILMICLVVSIEKCNFATQSRLKKCGKVLKSRLKKCNNITKSR